MWERRLCKGSGEEGGVGAGIVYRRSEGWLDWEWENSMNGEYEGKSGICGG